MIANPQQKVVKKTLGEVIVDVIALRSRSGGATFNEIVIVMRNYWKRIDGKALTEACIFNHLLKMTATQVLAYEDRPSERVGGKIRYYRLNTLPTEADTSKIILIPLNQAEPQDSLPSINNWKPPRLHVPRKANPLHQIGGAV